MIDLLSSERSVCFGAGALAARGLIALPYSGFTAHPLSISRNATQRAPHHGLVIAATPWTFAGTFGSGTYVRMFRSEHWIQDCPRNADSMNNNAAVKGLLAGVAGVAAMTAAEKVEQYFTGRPDS